MPANPSSGDVSHTDFRRREAPKVVANPIPMAKANESKCTIQLLSHIEHYNSVDTKSLESVGQYHFINIKLSFFALLENKRKEDLDRGSLGNFSASSEWQMTLANLVG